MQRLFAGLLLCLSLLASPALAMQVVTGSYTGNSSAGSNDNRDIVISPACQPSMVFIKGNTGGGGFDFVLSTTAMGADGTIVLTGTSAGIISNSIQAFNADGFEVGTSSTVNNNGSTYYYAAICDNGQNDFAVGSYTGSSGTDNRDLIISPAFQPSIVFVMSTNSGFHAWRGDTSHSGDNASRFNTAAADSGNFIQAFNADGFEVGSTFNTNAVTYYYVAFKGTASVTNGSFSGNGSDNQTKSVTTFTPDMVWIKGASATREMSYKLGSMAGDLSSCGEVDPTTDQIQALNSDGFQVGTSTCSNENAVTMRWFAITDLVGGSGMKARKPVRF
jgi:hypothetical protein